MKNKNKLKKRLKGKENLLKNTNTNLKKWKKYGIIKKVVHYSSYIIYYEGGAKNPLKGTSLKFLVCAQNAQLCV